MKKFVRLMSTALATSFLFVQAPVLAEEYTPFSIQTGGTGASTLEKAKENLEIPGVLHTAGQSETDVMSQKAVTDAIAAGSGGGIVVTQAIGQSATNVMSQKAVTDAIDSVQPSISQTVGQSETAVMSQKAVTDAIDNASQNTIVQTVGQSTTEVMSQKAVTDAINSIPQINVVHVAGQSTADVMSQKAVTEAILTAETIFNMIYPIDSIYMSANSADPSTLFGGTWVSWGSGRVPVGVNTSDSDFNTTEKTGGGKTHHHGFRIGTHWWYGAVAGEGAGNGTGAYRYSDGQYDGWARDLASKSMSVNTAAYNSQSSTTSTTGGKYSLGDTTEDSVLQPYITCHMWKRTA